MLRYFLVRLVHSLVVVVAVSLVAFFLVRFSGDPVALYLPLDAPESLRIELRDQLGLDRPIHIQLWGFATHALRGDFGESLRFAQPALPLVLERLPATFRLALWSLLLALFLGAPLGVLGALHRGRFLDQMGSVVTVLGQSLPAFWIGIVLILIFGVYLRWVPVVSTTGGVPVLLPAITLSVNLMAVIARVLRSSVLDVLGENYINTARAKGLGAFRIIARHVMPNAALPTLTIVGIQLGALLAGAVIVETVFGYPGMALLAVRAIRNRDLAIVQAFVVLMGVFVAAINLLVDLAYAVLDPRIRYG